MPVPATRTAARAVANGLVLRRAILRALIYADLFDQPLTRSELQRYLIGAAATTADIGAALEDDPVLRREVEQTGDWLYLAGRAHLVEVRRQRQAASASLWRLAQHYGAIIERLPFVRLVGVTGALAMNNARPGDDIDLFILVHPGRLWLGRLLVLGVVKLAARRGVELCPNFLLSSDHLQLTAQNLYVAHEVAQLVPLTRGRWYDAFVEANAWVRDFLPNALPNQPRRQGSARPRWAARITASILSTRLFDPLERWEMDRKVRRLTARLEREGGDARFSAHECRGHFAAHDVRILTAYRGRLAGHREALDGMLEATA